MYLYVLAILVVVLAVWYYYKTRPVVAVVNPVVAPVYADPAPPAIVPSTPSAVDTTPIMSTPAPSQTVTTLPSIVADPAPAPVVVVPAPTVWQIITGQTPVPVVVIPVPAPVPAPVIMPIPIIASTNGDGTGDDYSVPTAILPIVAAPVPAPVIVPAPVVVTIPVAVPAPVPSPVPATPKFAGCWKDTTVRAIPAGTFGIIPTTWDACRLRAQAAGANVFALEYPNGSKSTGQCFYGKNPSYTKYGPASCGTAKDAAGHYLGGVWVSAAYTT